MTQDNEAVSRRNFLRNAALTAVAATAAGTGAAALLSSRDDTVVISTQDAAKLVATSPPPIVQQAEAVIDAHTNAADLLARLSQSQAENMRLQSALDAAQRELESLRLASQQNSSASEELSLQLQSANARASVLAGLVALYDQLDDVDVGDVVEHGLTALSDTLDGLMAQAPVLSDGVALGQQALAEVEAHLPAVENGRFWLEAQISKVDGFYVSVERVLQNVLETVGDFLELVEEWFDGVRKWLPFGIGERAAEVVSALTALVAETPTTLSGLSDNVVQPLDAWVGRDEDELRLQRKLIRPLREDVLARAGDTVAQAQQVNATYQAELAAPVAAVAAQREAMRRQIAAYRQQHQI